MSLTEMQQAKLRDYDRLVNDLAACRAELERGGARLVDALAGAQSELAALRKETEKLREARQERDDAGKALVEKMYEIERLTKEHREYVDANDTPHVQRLEAEIERLTKQRNEHCPTCGSPVRVVTSGEGTSYYQPSERGDDAPTQATSRAVTPACEPQSHKSPASKTPEGITIRRGLERYLDVDAAYQAHRAVDSLEAEIERLRAVVEEVRLFRAGDAQWKAVLAALATLDPDPPMVGYGPSGP